MITSVDLFCGAGGMSTGILMATGQAPLMALNHSPAAILCHSTNHPDVLHLQEDVFRTRVVDVLRQILQRRQQLDLLALAPDCRHFSQAKGGAPVSESVRSLAWAAEEWAKWARPRMILLENVPEFVGWGPLYTDEMVAELAAEAKAAGRKLPKHVKVDRPIPDRKGETFREFVSRLRCHGYRVEWRVLNCADYGAPTSRRRLFLIARCDGPITWPEPTHGPGREQPWHTAAEHLDFSLPTPSIFLTKKEAQAWYEEHGKAAGWGGAPNRPLADKTLRRIAAGVVRFVLQAADPFLLTLTHGGRLRPLDQPLPTITAANRGEMALVSPTVARIGQTGGNGAYAYPADRPLSTIVSKREHLLVSSCLINMRNGERARQAPRVRSVEKPLWTITSNSSPAALVSAFLAKHYTGAVGQPLNKPLGTITAQDHHSLVAAHLTKMYGTSTGAPADGPCPTITGGGQHIGLIAAFLQKYYGEGIGQPLDKPIGTLTSRERFGLVTVRLDGEEYALADIGMRMLTPEELKLCQGFPEDYVLTGNKGERVAHVGRSVPPQVVAALVSANLVAAPAALAAK